MIKEAYQCSDKKKTEPGEIFVKQNGCGFKRYHGKYKKKHGELKLEITLVYPVAHKNTYKA